MVFSQINCNVEAFLHGITLGACKSKMFCKKGVCVCVLGKEREREREQTKKISFSLIKRLLSLAV